MPYCDIVAKLYIMLTIVSCLPMIEASFTMLAELCIHLGMHL